MALVLAKNCKLYIQTDGVAGSAGWVELTNITDVTLGGSTERADVTTRGGNGFVQEAPTLKNATISFDLILDDTDTGGQSLRTAWLSSGVIGVRCLTGDDAAEASEGLVADMSVVDFTRNEGLRDAVRFSVELAPAISATAPTYVVEGPDYVAP